MFLAKLSGPSIGITAWNFLVIDKSLILSVSTFETHQDNVKITLIFEHIAFLPLDIRLCDVLSMMKWTHESITYDKALIFREITINSN